MNAWTDLLQVPWNSLGDLGIFCTNVATLDGFLEIHRSGAGGQGIQPSDEGMGTSSPSLDLWGGKGRWELRWSPKANDLIHEALIKSQKARVQINFQVVECMKEDSREGVPKEGVEAHICSHIP